MFYLQVNMPEFKANYYRLTPDEIEKANVRERIFNQNSNMHPNILYQNINLDIRQPTLSEQLTKEHLELDSIIINRLLEENTFAIDIIDSKGKLISRYLLIPRKNLTINNQYDSFKISKHIGCMMSDYDNEIKIYTINDFLDK